MKKFFIVVFFSFILLSCSKDNGKLNIKEIKKANILLSFSFLGASSDINLYSKKIEKVIYDAFQNRRKNVYYARDLFMLSKDEFFALEKDCYFASIEVYIKRTPSYSISYGGKDFKEKYYPFFDLEIIVRFPSGEKKINFSGRSLKDLDKLFW